MKRFFILFVAVLSACASPPNIIQEAQIPESRYASFTCEQLAAEYIRVDQRYSVLYNEQSKANSEDALGVALVGLPLGSMGAKMSNSEREKTISQLKGEKATMLRVQKSKSC